MIAPGKRVLFDKVGYQPHPGQVLIHEAVDNSRFIAAVCGRRTGKSFAASYETIFQILQTGDSFGPPVVYVVADSYAHTSKLFFTVARTLQRHFKPLVRQVYKKDRIIELTNDATVYAKSADSPASLAGDGVSFAVIDESGFVDDYAVDVLMPSLLERQGVVLAIGTPDRATWFKDWFDTGLAGDPDYTALQLPTSANPYIDASDIEKERNRRSEDFFAKYYLAEWLNHQAAPFHNIHDLTVIHNEALPPMPGRRYVAGVDLADRIDFTAVVVVDVTEKPYRVVKVDKWQGIGYQATGRRVAGLLKLYNNAKGFVDATGVGDAAITFITQHYGNVDRVIFTQREKQTMFDTISAALDNKELELLDESTLISEMRTLKATETLKGVSYAAPKGQHDDAIFALFLAGKGFNRNFFIPRNEALGGFATTI